METKVRATIDSSAAKRELRGLERTATTTAQRLGGSLRRQVGGGLRSISQGVGIGAGIQAVRGAAGTGFGDVFGSLFATIGASIEEAVLPELGPRARAIRATLGSLSEGSLRAAGTTEGLASLTPLIQQRLRLETQAQQGSRTLQQQFGIKPEEIITKIVDALGSLIESAITGAATIISNAVREAIFGSDGGNN